MSNTCPVPDCARPVRKAGICDTHYARFRRNGLLPSPAPTACITCGASIHPTTLKARKFCSEQCLRDHHNPIRIAADSARRAISRSGGACDRCGAIFNRTKSNARFCSKTCNMAFHTSAHRSRVRGVDAERFRHVDVFERDGWVCQLCGSPVDPALRGQTSLAPSLDHIIPISRGGAHTMANTQLAHFGCNARKRDRVQMVSS